MEKKPRIQVGDVYVHRGQTLCIPYEFFDENGEKIEDSQMNFPLDVEEEEILRDLENRYKTVMEARKPEKREKREKMLGRLKRKKID